MMLEFPKDLFLKGDTFVLGFVAFLTLYIGDVVSIATEQNQTLREIKIRSSVWFTTFVFMIGSMVWLSVTLDKTTGDWEFLLGVSLIACNMINNVKTWEKCTFIISAKDR